MTMPETIAPEVLENQIMEITVEVVLDDTTISEVVPLTLGDFALQSVQALAYWEEVDPVAYAKFTEGEITSESLSRSALTLRGFLYSIIKSKVGDRQIRQAMTVEDFDVAATELSAAVGAISDLNL
jgi:hypothetical protein